jgi:tRNA(Ile)-lysidine synthase
MQIDLSQFLSSNQTIGVALSGGGDSMALLYYMLCESKKYHFNVIAINVEHGIRGQASKDDTNFVINYCKDNQIKLLTYSVDCPTYAKEHKLSLEQAGRILRYQCFSQALEGKACDKIATAHHLKDNFESVLFNLFRGTGLKGLIGIEENFKDKIIRPFLSVSKQEIEEYIKENSIPFVNDQTNFSDEYTRNAIRLNLLPEIEKLFPEAQKSVYRFSQIAKAENDYMHTQALNSISVIDNKVEIKLPQHDAILSRATLIALQTLGLNRDWEKAHIDSIIELATLKNSSKISLPNRITAVKEYDKITFYKDLNNAPVSLPFSVGQIKFNQSELIIEQANESADLKSGLFCDGDKIPNGAVIRTRLDGDKFTKFGGGTKSLNDYLTDKKIPLMQRDNLALLALDNDVLAICGVAISDKIKVDKNTKNILQLK